MRKLKLEELERSSLDEYIEQEKHPVVVVLDNVRSALNVGSVFRTCDGLAIDHIYLCGITAKPPHKEINKTAIGATSSVSWTYAEDIVDVVKLLSSQSYKVIGVEQTTASISLMDFRIEGHDQKLAIIFGNEVEGLSDELLPLLDVALEIPQYGTKHSFNVAVCAGMVLWELIKQIKS